MKRISLIAYYNFCKLEISPRLQIKHNIGFLSEMIWIDINR